MLQGLANAGRTNRFDSWNSAVGRGLLLFRKDPLLSERLLHGELLLQVVCKIVYFKPEGRGVLVYGGFVQLQAIALLHLRPDRF